MRDHPEDGATGKEQENINWLKNELSATTSMCWEESRRWQTSSEIKQKLERKKDSPR